MATQSNVTKITQKTMAATKLMANNIEDAAAESLQNEFNLNDDEARKAVKRITSNVVISIINRLVDRVLDKLLPKEEKK